MMKRTLLIFLLPVFLFAQDSFYLSDNFYGGGVGFSQMFLFMDIGKLNGFELLSAEPTDTTSGLGLDTKDFAYPFVINGGEGFSHITGRWRLGGYAGVGSSSISDKMDVTLYYDSNGNGVFDTGTDTSFAYKGDYAPDVQAKFSMWIGGATVEYVFPIFRGLEVATGTLIGIGRANLNITQSSGNPSWEDQFSNLFGIGSNGYYAIPDANGDNKIDSTDSLFVQTTAFPPFPKGSALSSLSGTFFNVQPYMAVKLQFLDRVGLRLSIGFNLGKIRKGGWSLNNANRLYDSPESKFNGLAMRAMIYFGL